MEILHLVVSHEIHLRQLSVRSAMRAASQPPGGEPTDVDDTPAPTR